MSVGTVEKSQHGYRPDFWPTDANGGPTGVAEVCSNLHETITGSCCTHFPDNVPLFVRCLAWLRDNFHAPFSDWDRALLCLVVQTLNEHILATGNGCPEAGDHRRYTKCSGIREGMENQRPQLLSLPALAEVLKLPERWIQAEADAGRIPCLRVGHHYRFNRQAVERVLLDRAQQAGGEGVANAR